MKDRQQTIPLLFPCSCMSILSLLFSYHFIPLTAGLPGALTGLGTVLLSRHFIKTRLIRILLASMVFGLILGTHAQLLERLPERSSPSAIFFKNLQTKTSEALHAKLAGSGFSEAETGVLIALVCGNKDNLEQKTRQNFQQTGVAHLLALSGLHIGIIYNLLQKIFFFLPGFGGRWAKIRGALTLTLLWLYALITGMTASISRAVLMCSCYEISGWQEEPKNGLHALSVSALLLICFDPRAPLDLGFQLSYLAMLGIFLIHPLLETLFEKQWPDPPVTGVRQWVFKTLNRLWKVLSLTLSCQLSTLPILLTKFKSFPLAFQLANLLAAPLTAWIIQSLPGVLLLEHLFPSWDSPIQAVHVPLKLLLKIVETIRHFSYLCPLTFNKPNPWEDYLA